MSQAPSLLLAMDTSGDICSVAVLRDGQFLAEYAFRHGMHLSERLMEYVDATLKSADAVLADIEAFAVGIGPGSFTGTRIGVMTMKTFALTQNRPLVGIGGLEAMAAEYAGLPEVLVIPVIPCRVGSVYACPFRVHDNTPAALAEPAAFTFAELGGLLQQWEAERFLYCGPVAARYETELRSALGAKAGLAAFGAVSYSRASVVGGLACRRLAAGVPPDDALNLVPLYISPPPISTPRQPIPIG